MPGQVGDTYKGPRGNTPYVPSWCYPNGSPKMCLCGHHEGYHSSDGKCSQCACAGLQPAEEMLKLPSKDGGFNPPKVGQ